MRYRLDCRTSTLTPKELITRIVISMYGSETDPALRGEIVNALFIQGNAKAMVELARKETNPELKKMIVSKLSVMGNKDATEYLMELLNK